MGLNRHRKIIIKFLITLSINFASSHHQVSEIKAFRHWSERLSRKNKSFLDNTLCLYSVITTS